MAVSQAARTPDAGHSTSTQTHLPPVWVWPARMVWIGFAAASLMFMIARTDETYNLVLGAALGFEQALALIGLTPAFFIGFMLALRTLGYLIATLTGALLFWKRQNDWLALIAALAALASSVEFPQLMMTVISVGRIPQPTGMAVFFFAATTWSFLWLMALFPQGRFAPRWIVAVPLLYVLYIGYVLTVSEVTPQMTGIPGLFFAAAFGGQVYRYYRVSTPTERQQAKWVLLGFAAAVIGVFGMVIPLTSFFPLRDPGLPRLLYSLIGGLLWLGAMAAPQAAILFSIIRYRLWDIDFLINRSLVYGGLTAALLVVFAVFFAVMRAIVEPWFGSERTWTVLVVAMAVVIGLFPPMRAWLRRLVDKGLYGIDLDYGQAARGEGGQAQVGERGTARTSFGGYTGMELIGKGGMGEVYRAQHPALNRTVAVKVLPWHLQADEQAQRRFTREAQAIARLNHPNIVGLHEFGEEDGTPYMVMEYVEGRTLAELIKERGRLTLDEALPILWDVAAALDAAHGQGIVHRDVKAGNVVIASPPGPLSTPSGLRATDQLGHAPTDSPQAGEGQQNVEREGEKPGRAVLMDFGIAHMAAGMTRLTASGSFVGTLDTIAPEQIQGAEEVDGRADVYSLGVVAYQTLTGELPFKHNNPGAMVMAHLMQPPPDPRGLAADVPEGAAYAIMRAMAKKPEERFGTAGEFVAALAG